MPAAAQAKSKYIYEIESLKEEFVTPKHSTAFGRLVTGTQVELGMLSYKAGEGAEEHSHPHEQIFLVLSGKAKMTIAGEPTIMQRGQVALIPPNVPHQLDV